MPWKGHGPARAADGHAFRNRHAAGWNDGQLHYTLACGTPSALGGGGSLHASFPALLVTVAASEQVLVSRRDAMRAPHGFSQCEQLRTEASSSLQPRHELA